MSGGAPLVREADALSEGIAARLIAATGHTSSRPHKCRNGGRTNDVHQLWSKDRGGAADWSSPEFTSAFKRLLPVTQFRATTKLGEFLLKGGGLNLN